MHTFVWVMLVLMSIGAISNMADLIHPERKRVSTTAVTALSFIVGVVLCAWAGVLLFA